MSLSSTEETANNQESFSDIATVIEMARRHFITMHGREPRADECIFDQEPPSDLWTPAVLCCELLIKEAKQ